MPLIVTGILWAGAIGGGLFVAGKGAEDIGNSLMKIGVTTVGVIVVLKVTKII